LKGVKSNKTNESSAVIFIPAIPPNTDLEYEVEVLSHLLQHSVDPDVTKEYNSTFFNSEVTDINQLNQEDLNRLIKLSELILRKECGNRWYLYQDYPRAAKAYSHGTKIAHDYFNSTKGSPDEVEYRIEKLDEPLLTAYITCLNNLAACHLSTGEFLKAKDMCIKILELDANNIKALLRASKATLALYVSKNNFTYFCILFLTNKTTHI
jgi:tetratricopeptide (TPR) repeat protein